MVYREVVDSGTAIASAVLCDGVFVSPRKSGVDWLRIDTGLLQAEGSGREDDAVLPVSSPVLCAERFALRSIAVPDSFSHVFP